MTMRIYLLLIAFSLSACTQIQVNDAEVTNPKNLSIERLQLKTLSNEAREALNATNPDALIAVFTEDGVTLYGAPGKAFKLEPEGQLKHKSTNKSRIDAKGPVNEVIIKTFSNSPLCHYYKDLGGNRVWYPSYCP